MKSALVTGATGFLGRALVRRMSDDGVRVACLTRAGSDRSVLDSRAQVLETDGSTAAVVAAVGQASPDVVFHLASCFIAEHTTQQVAPLIESNVLFGAQLLEAMDAVGCDALVNTGTSWQHFGGADYDPVCLYAATKQAFEDVALFYSNARGMRVQTLQLFDTYGADDPRPKLFHALRRAVADGSTLEMSPGEQLIDLVNVADVVAAFEVAAERALASDAGANEAWAVSSGARLSLHDLVERWQAVTGRKVDAHWGGRPYRDREVMEPWTGPVLPGWVPITDLDEGLAAMESEFAKRGR